MNTGLGSANSAGPAAGRQRIYVIVLPLARMLFGIVALCGVVAAGAGGYWMAAGSDGVERLFAPAPSAEPQQAMHDLPELIVNLWPETPSRFLKIGITLVTAEADRGRIEPMKPYLLNGLQDFLRNLDQKDLQGSAGLFRMRSELRRRFNLILGQEIVADVLLRSILTQ